MTNKHIFALFYPELSDTTNSFAKDSQISLVNQDIINRVMHVLRLSKEDYCIFFDQSVELLCVIDMVRKKEILCKVVSAFKHARKGAHVTVLLPLLKKEDFDSALYALGAVGAHDIQVVTTEKTQRPWHKERDAIRARNILISAAEQSKYFSMPFIHEPQPLQHVINKCSSLSDLKIVADPRGESLGHLFISNTPLDRVIMLVGPEGGLTDQEYSLVSHAGFVSYRLTPTILKAEHAITILSGILRSI